MPERPLFVNNFFPVLAYLCYISRATLRLNPPEPAYGDQHVQQ